MFIWHFLQFFVAPLISEDGVQREVKAVDSECVPCHSPLIPAAQHLQARLGLRLVQ